MSFLSWVLLGFCAGLIAQALTGGRRHGIIMTSILGIIGAFVGGFVYQLFGADGSIDEFSWGSLLTSVIGAFVLILGYDLFSRKK